MQFLHFFTTTPLEKKSGLPERKEQASSILQYNLASSCGLIGQRKCATNSLLFQAAYGYALDGKNVLYIVKKKFNLFPPSLFLSLEKLNHDALERIIIKYIDDDINLFKCISSIQLTSIPDFIFLDEVSDFFATSDLLGIMKLLGLLNVLRDCKGVKYVFSDYSDNSVAFFENRVDLIVTVLKNGETGHSFSATSKLYGQPDPKRPRILFSFENDSIEINRIDFKE